MAVSWRTSAIRKCNWTVVVINWAVILNRLVNVSEFGNVDKDAAGY